MKNHPVDVLMFYTDRVDQVYHFCRERADGDLITTAHLELDRLLEKLVKQYSPENIVVFSDHGNVPITKFVGYKEQLFKAQFSEEKQEYYNQVRPITADIVLCMGVLHHCPDPFAVIKALGKAAAPRARLILETITVKSKETVMMRGHQGDEWYFSESAMKQILNKYGNFTVAEVVYTGLDSLNRMRTFFFARHGIDADSLSKLSEEEDRGSTSSFSLPIPDPPPLVSPIDGASDVDLRPTFKWRTISDVDFYWLHVVDETEGEKTILEVAIYPPTTEYSSQKSLDKGHTYRWAVYTHNPNGFSSLGEVRRFTT